jgi:hypothetical protein
MGIGYDDFNTRTFFVEHDLGDSAGASALTTKVGMSADHGIMSIFSPWLIDTACTREPRMPTQAPTGSTEESREMTAIWRVNRVAATV